MSKTALKMVEPDHPEIHRLVDVVDRRLRLHELPDSNRFPEADGEPSEGKCKAIASIMRAFDAANSHRLLSEAKRLSGGDGIISDVAVPAIWERTVIREALFRMGALDLVDAGTAAFSGSVSIPYSYRDTAAAGRNNTRVYEGGEVPRAGIIQTAESAYPIPQKLAFAVTDELRHLSSSAQFDWDVLKENALNAARIIGEDTDAMAYNEILQASDEYGAVAVVAEDLELQADDVKTIFILANFPVVRPRAIYDLQGNQVGSTSNPITVSYNSVARSEYDGTGSQPAGIYYVLDYNLGEIYLVDEAGAVQVPADGTTYTISYSYTTNCYAFDTDNGAVDVDVHWDAFLYRYGLRKSVIEDDRYHMANMGLMSGSVMTQVEQAKKFSANFRIPGTDLSADGSLGRIKNVPNFKTSGPGLWLGDQRIIIGERGVTRYRLLKPWLMTSLENQRGPNGRFTGKKEAYGDQFIAIHTPSQLKRAYTSMVLYSGAGRIAR